MMRRHSQQRGIAALVLLPFIAALLAWPLIAMRAQQIAEQKRHDAEVAKMLKRPVPASDVAQQAQQEAEAEVLPMIQF